MSSPDPSGVPDRRAEILRVATEVFGERGYRGTSLALIAARVGISAPGVLHHFRTKDELLMEVLRERERQFARAAEGSPAGLVESMRYVVERMLAQPGVPQSMMVLSADSVTEGHPAHGFFVERYARLRSGLAAGIAEEYGDPAPNGLSAHSAATLLIAVLDGVRLQWLLDPEQVDLADRIDEFVQLLVRPAGAPGPS